MFDYRTYRTPIERLDSIGSIAFSLGLRLKKISEISVLKSSGKVIFRKTRSEVLDYLQRYSSLSAGNGTSEIYLSFQNKSSVFRPFLRSDRNRTPSK